MNLMDLARNATSIPLQIMDQHVKGHNALSDKSLTRKANVLIVRITGFPVKTLKAVFHLRVDLDKR